MANPTVTSPFAPNWIDFMVKRQGGTNFAGPRDNNALHLTAAALRFFRVQRLTSRRAK